MVDQCYDRAPNFQDEVLFSDFHYGPPDRILLADLFDPVFRREVNSKHPFPNQRSKKHAGVYLFYDTLERFPFLYQIVPLYAGRSSYLAVRLWTHYYGAAQSSWLERYWNWFFSLPHEHLLTGNVMIGVWYTTKRHEQVGREQALIAQFVPKFNRQRA